MSRPLRMAALTLLATVVGLAGWWIATVQQEVRAQDKPMHRLVFHVTENDAEKMNLVLNNTNAASATWLDKKESYAIEIVAIGPGLHMFREDTSPVKPRLKAMAESIPHLTFSACENTRRGMAKREGKEIPLVAQARSVPSGIVRLVELEEQGWTYARP